MWDLISGSLFGSFQASWGKVKRAIPICFGLIGLIGDYSDVYIFDPFYLKIVHILSSHGSRTFDLCLTTLENENGISHISLILYLLFYFHLLLYSFLL